MSDSPGADSPETGDSEISRRSLIASAGVALVGGSGLVTTLPAVAAEAAGSGDKVAVGERGTTVVEFSSRIAQTGSSGEDFTSYGYLTRVAGVTQSRLFAGPSQTVSAARLTAYASGTLSARFVDQAVHSIDIAGELVVYQRDTPGADFAHPNSFRVGTVVARYDVRLLDVLTVIAPGQGLPTLIGDMNQTRAHDLSSPFASRRFGAQGQRLRFQATGIGSLTDPATLNSLHEIAGCWSVE